MRKDARQTSTDSRLDSLRVMVERLTALIDAFPEVAERHATRLDLIEQLADDVVEACVVVTATGVPTDTPEYCAVIAQFRTMARTLIRDMETDAAQRA